jgi:hypothetical protein
MSATDEWIARQNMERFRWLIAGEADDKKRQTLERLLAEEEEKLRRIQSCGASNPDGAPSSSDR